MARDFNGTTHCLTVSDIAAHDWSNPFTIAALVYTDTVAAGDYNIMSHGDSGTPLTGWRFRLTTDKLKFSTNGQWGADGTATTALSTAAWYGVACTKASASTLVTYYRYLLSTRTMASETVETFANGYTDGTSPTRIGAAVANGTNYQFWDGRIARVGLWMGSVLTQAELEQFFLGKPVRMDTCDGWWELFGTSDPDPDWSPNQAHATNVSTTRIDHPPGIGFPMMTSRPMSFIPDAAASQGARTLVGVG